MVCAPLRSIIPSLKLGDYLSVQAHKPCSISHLNFIMLVENAKIIFGLAYNSFTYTLSSSNVMSALHCFFSSFNFVDGLLGPAFPSLFAFE